MIFAGSRKFRLPGRAALGPDRVGRYELDVSGDAPPARGDSPQFEPALDPSGFDRDRFHESLPALILEWIRERGGVGGTRAER